MYKINKCKIFIGKAALAWKGNWQFWKLAQNFLTLVPGQQAILILEPCQWKSPFLCSAGILFSIPHIWSNSSSANTLEEVKVLCLQNTLMHETSNLQVLANITWVADLQCSYQDVLFARLKIILKATKVDWVYIDSAGNKPAMVQPPPFSQRPLRYITIIKTEVLITLVLHVLKHVTLSLTLFQVNRVSNCFDTKSHFSDQACIMSWLYSSLCLSSFVYWTVNSRQKIQTSVILMEAVKNVFQLYFTLKSNKLYFTLQLKIWI